jgi:hypothetical protein
MTTNGERKVGLSLAAAGVGIVGVAIVFGLTTASGSPDWVGIITAIAGVVMIVTGLFRGLGKGTPHTA